MTNVYFSCPIRSNSDISIHNFINIMEEIGLNVLTKHMATNPDLNKSDSEIHDFDMELLKKADVVIIETSFPSIGVGYITGIATSLGKPILSIRKRNSTKLSAMINGNNRITKFTYTDITSISKCINTFIKSLNNRVYFAEKSDNIILFMGAPGSGKSTIGKMIQKKFENIYYVSTGDLLRNMVKEKRNINQISYEFIEQTMNLGKLIPSDIMAKIVFSELSEILKSQYVILDGYPPSSGDIDEFKKMFSPKCIFWFDINKETSIERQILRNERKTDNLEKANCRYDVFIQNLSQSLVTSEFNMMINQINCIESKDTVFNNVFSKIKTIYDSFDLNSSFRLINPKIEKSTRFHFHIDGMGWSEIKAVLPEIYKNCDEYDLDIKNYPIYSLDLSKQTYTDSAYIDMMNFHKITKENRTFEPEAFCTGRFGEEFNSEMYKKILKVISNSDIKMMTEVEQYIGEWSLSKDDILTEIIYEPFDLDIPSFFPDYEDLRVKSKKYELHHAVDIPKNSVDNFDSIFSQFCEFLKRDEFDVGGIFIFFNKDTWKIRTNEFSDKTHRENVENIFAQAKLIKEFFELNSLKVSVDFSIEIVHAIYQF